MEWFLALCAQTGNLGHNRYGPSPNSRRRITALDPYRQYLPTHFNYAWVDTLSSPIRWDDMFRGTGLALVYSAIFLGYAWLRFGRKDITS